MALHTYCTYFDQNYLVKGVALYRSLLRNDPNCVLWILCLDDSTREILECLNLVGVRLVSLPFLEQWEPRLPISKKDRSRVEYYWTCTPTLVTYVLAQQNQGDVISYLDADLYFFSSPQEVYDEMASTSVLIHGHRYAPQFLDKERYSGTYNVGWIGFRNDVPGWETLRWWQDSCLKACYLRPEEGMCGDQKYLDDWPEHFNGVHVLKHIGAGLAPWNLPAYRLDETETGWKVDDHSIIFFHFHAMQFIMPNLIMQGGYHVSTMARKVLYKPYLKEIRQSLALVRSVSPGFKSGFKCPGLKDLLLGVRNQSLIWDI